MAFDYRSAAEIKRDARNKKITRLYTKYRKENPDISDRKIFMRIAAETEVSHITIRDVCISSGVIPNKNNYDNDRAES